MPKVTITRHEEDQLRLEEVLVDGDQKAALEFLKQVVKARIEQRVKGRCKPPV